MSILRDWMIGWHQGGAERHEARAERHRDAERRWRDKRKVDPYECRGGLAYSSHQAAMEWAEKYAQWKVEKGWWLLEPPSTFVCSRGHIHAKVVSRRPAGAGGRP